MLEVGRTIALATKHSKERVLRRPFQWALGLNLRVAYGVDTDRFGTFSGERLRPADPLTTCRLKAEAAMDALELDLGLASEGAFGPHPAVPLLPIGQEWLVLIDRPNQLFIHEHQISRHTNFSCCTATRATAIAAWLGDVGFPSHGLMVRPHEPTQRQPPPWLAKGIHHIHQLDQVIAEAVALSSLDLAWVETDMRACCNPTRMASIRRLAFKLVRRLRVLCPACGSPGWGVIGSLPGLPCAACGLATKLAKADQLGCARCDHRELRNRSIVSADPSYCDYCNP